MEHELTGPLRATSAIIAMFAVTMFSHTVSAQQTPSKSADLTVVLALDLIDQ